MALRSGRWCPIRSADQGCPWCTVTTGLAQANVIARILDRDGGHRQFFTTSVLADGNGQRLTDVLI